jgi:hypothetical protein
MLLHHLLPKGLSNSSMANSKTCMTQSRTSCVVLLSMKTPTQATAARCEVDCEQKAITLRTFSHLSDSRAGYTQVVTLTGDTGMTGDQGKKDHTSKQSFSSRRFASERDCSFIIEVVC